MSSLKSFDVMANIKWISNRENLSSEAIRLLGYLYKQLDNVCHALSRKDPDIDEDKAFYAVQRIITWVIFCDGDFDSDEYSTYKSYCSMAGFKSLSTENLKALWDRTDADQIIKDINIVKAFRPYVEDPDDYSAFCNGLWALAWKNGKINRREYELIICMYDPDVDTSVYDFDTFLKKWNND